MKKGLLATLCLTVLAITLSGCHRSDHASKKSYKKTSRDMNGKQTKQKTKKKKVNRDGMVETTEREMIERKY